MKVSAFPLCLAISFYIVHKISDQMSFSFLKLTDTVLYSFFLFFLETFQIQFSRIRLFKIWTLNGYISADFRGRELCARFHFVWHFIKYARAFNSISTKWDLSLKWWKDIMLSPLMGNRLFITKVCASNLIWCYIQICNAFNYPEGITTTTNLDGLCFTNRQR